ncbi:IS3 family transposase [Lacticaseibacillus paracasei]|uniref:IS3 family transposase n=1 Tax=Lacticaseibacillus paracasei TaxID=1597 RepID=UPI000EB62E9C|nr:IS3 family transposase [Lacticaseibacillus paracasei]AYG22507.1 IS3 family transposase [Lacticaseibacillus paracasei]
MQELTQEVTRVTKRYHSVSLCCQIFDIPRSAYYKWLHREPTKQDIMNTELVRFIKKLEEDNHYIYGVDRLRMIINQETDYHVNPKRVRRLMQDNGIQCSIRQKKHDRVAEKKEYILGNKLLNQDGSHAFHPTRPNEVWVTDCSELTYGFNSECHLRLSAIKDLYDHSIVAWEVEPSETATLVTQTFRAAAEAEETLPELLHSDQGSGHTSRLYNTELAGSGVIHSMSRPGTPGDNSPMESLWSHAKTEYFDFVHANTYEEMMQFIEEYVLWYNGDRHQETLNGMTPAEYRNHAIETAA